MADASGEIEERLARVTRLLSTQRSLPSKLEAVAELARRTVPNCDAAGISLVVQGTPTTAGASSHLALEIDLVQYRTDEGPCLSAIRTGQHVRIDVLGHDERFVHFAPGAIDLGIESTLSIPLDVGGTTVGSLNLYSQTEWAFGEETDAAAVPIAAYAAEVLSTSPLYAYSLDVMDGLIEDLEARELIATAVGILRAADRVTEAEAIDVLRHQALDESVSLRDVAERLVHREHRT